MASVTSPSMPQTMTLANPTTEPANRPKVRCSFCGHVVFDGLAVKSRVVVLDDSNAKAKCRCKHWVSVPVAYSG